MFVCVACVAFFACLACLTRLGFFACVPCLFCFALLFLLCFALLVPRTDDEQSDDDNIRATAALKPVKPSIDLKDLPKKLISATTKEERQRLLRAVHERFWHASPSDMVRLLTAACLPKDIIVMGAEVAKDCTHCAKFAPKMPTARIKSTLATQFGESVQTDLFFLFDEVFVLIIDEAIRWKSGNHLPGKETKHLLNNLMSSWIRIFGPPKHLITDQEGALMSSEATQFCEQFGITRVPVGQGRVGSKGLVERHISLTKHSMLTLKKQLDSQGIAVTYGELIMESCMAQNHILEYNGGTPQTALFGQQTRSWYSPEDDHIMSFDGADSQRPDAIESAMRLRMLAKQCILQSIVQDRIARAAAHRQHKHEAELLTPGTMVGIWRKPKTGSVSGWHGPAELISVQRRAGSAIVVLQGLPLLIPLHHIRKHKLLSYFQQQLRLDTTKLQQLQLVNPQTVLLQLLDDNTTTTSTTDHQQHNFVVIPPITNRIMDIVEGNMATGKLVWIGLVWKDSNWRWQPNKEVVDECLALQLCIKLFGEFLGTIHGVIYGNSLRRLPKVDKGRMALLLRWKASDRLQYITMMTTPNGKTFRGDDFTDWTTVMLYSFDVPADDVMEGPDPSMIDWDDISSIDPKSIPPSPSPMSWHDDDDNDMDTSAPDDKPKPPTPFPDMQPQSPIDTAAAPAPPDDPPTLPIQQTPTAHQPTTTPDSVPTTNSEPITQPTSKQRRSSAGSATTPLQPSTSGLDDSISMKPKQPPDPPPGLPLPATIPTPNMQAPQPSNTDSTQRSRSPRRQEEPPLPTATDSNTDTNTSTQPEQPSNTTTDSQATIPYEDDVNSTHYSTGILPSELNDKERCNLFISNSRPLHQLFNDLTDEEDPIQLMTTELSTDLQQYLPQDQLYYLIDLQSGELLPDFRVDDTTANLTDEDLVKYKDLVHAADHKELKQFVHYDVFRTETTDNLQHNDNIVDCVWVRKWKVLHKEVKSRMCARGCFDKQKHLIEKHSSTATRLSQRLVISLGMADGVLYGKEVSTESLDISGAFLQGLTYSELAKLARQLGYEARQQRRVFVRPPENAWRHWRQMSEAPAHLKIPDSRRVTTVLRCIRAMYGFTDAPLMFQLALISFLKNECEAKTSVFDENYLYWIKTENHRPVLILVMTVHVDDLQLTGAKVYRDWIHDKLEKRFGKLKRQTMPYTHAGLQLEQLNPNILLLHQDHFTSKLQLIVIDKQRLQLPTSPCTPEETTSFRSAVCGALWACQTRVDELCAVTALQTYLKTPCVQQMIDANALIRRLRRPNEKIGIFFRRIYPPFRTLTVSDASPSNKSSNFATEGIITLLCEDRLPTIATDNNDYLDEQQVQLMSGHCHILQASSNKAKRVSHSTSHAETNSAARAIPLGQLTALRITEPDIALTTGKTITPTFLMHLQDESRLWIPHDHIIDAMDLWELACGMRGIPQDKSQRLGVLAIREERRTLRLRRLIHCTTGSMLADMLTKFSGIDSKSLLELLTSGHYTIKPPLRIRQHFGRKT